MPGVEVTVRSLLQKFGGGVGGSSGSRCREGQGREIGVAQFRTASIMRNQSVVLGRGLIVERVGSPSRDEGRVDVEPGWDVLRVKA